MRPEDEKLQLELEKLRAEISKIHADLRKTIFEANKLEQEVIFYPFVVGTGVTLALIGLLKLFL